MAPELYFLRLKTAHGLYAARRQYTSTEKYGDDVGS